MDTSLIDGLQRALADHCSPERIRALEAGADAQPLWQLVASLGYADAFVPAEHGGIGLPLGEAFALGQALGRAGYPLPLLDTAVARALLASAGLPAPDGPIVLCDGMPAAQGAAQGGVALASTPGLRMAGHALVQHAGHWHLLALDPALAQAGAYRPQLSGTRESVDLSAALQRFAAPCCAATLTAPLQAAEMAGAMAALLDLTVAYAGDRRQFGKPIGQFQALQQEIAVMAEQVACATLAARLGCSGTLAQPDALRGASAKLIACDAAARVVAIAHAVHGAIGITDEYALELYARRLHEWCGSGATAGASAQALGTALLQHPGRLLDFVREALPAA